MLLKSSLYSKAAVLAELKSSHAANATALADNTRALADNARMLSSRSSRVDDVDQRQQALSARQNADIARQDAVIARHDADIAMVRADIARNNSGNKDSLCQCLLEDSREIIVHGIPLAVQLEPLPLTNALLTAVNLQQHTALVVGWRAWNPLARAAPAQHAGPVDSAAPAALAHPVPSRALVFTLACAAARDDILRKTPGLKSLDCQTIFGTGGAAKLSVNALWPDPVHKLLKYATSRYKQLGYLRPLVKNLVVFMRPTKDGPLLPVTCEADIDALAPLSLRTVPS